MVEKSNCQRCGAKFRWWLRHRHYCARCKAVVCDNCSEQYSYTPNRVKQWNFEAVEFCKDCYPLNLRDLATERLDEVIAIYFRSKHIAYNITTDYRGFTDEEEEYFLKIKDMSNKIFYKASLKGYLSGVSDGKEQNKRQDRKDYLQWTSRLGKSIFEDKDGGKEFNKFIEEKVQESKMRSLKGRTDETQYQTSKRIFGNDLITELNDGAYNEYPGLR